MRQIASLFLSAFLLTHTLGHTAQTDPDTGRLVVYFFSVGDFAYLVFTQLDLMDQVSMSLVSKGIRPAAKTMIVKLHPDAFKLEAINAGSYKSFFRRWSELKFFKFDRPLTITAATDEDLRLLTETLKAIPCISTQNLTIENTAAQLNPACKLGSQLPTLLTSQPNLNNLTIQGSPQCSEELTQECAQIIGNCQNLTSLTITCINVGFEALDALANSASLTNLSCNNINISGLVVRAARLPNYLKVLKISGGQFNQQFFSCLNGFKTLSSISINACWGRDSQSIDISDGITKVLELNLSELEIHGMYCINSDAIKKIAQKNAERTSMRLGKTQDGKATLDLAMSKTPPNYESASEELISEMCSILAFEILHLDRAGLSAPMARALKQCTSLHTLSVMDIDPTITADDMPNVKVLELCTWSNHIGQVLKNLTGLEEVAVQMGEGDISSFVPFVRAKKLKAAVLVSLSGNPQAGFFIRAIGMGGLSKKMNDWVGQGLDGGCAVLEDGQPAPQVVIPQEFEYSLINSDITDEFLLLLQNRPGLTKLDLSGSLGITIQGLTAVLKNKTLKKLVVPSEFAIQAGALQSAFPHINIRFAD